MAKQNLTPTAKRMKAARDKKVAMTDDRRKKKAAEKRAQYLKDNPRAFRGF